MIRSLQQGHPLTGELAFATALRHPGMLIATDQHQRLGCQGVALHRMRTHRRRAEDHIDLAEGEQTLGNGVRIGITIATIVQ